MSTFEPHYCDKCDQALEYKLEIDKGTVDITKKIAQHIKKKGINAVHLSKEMLGELTHHQIGNISRPRFHGLVAKVKGNPGNYCLTTKGLAFLKGMPINRVAIVVKGTRHTPPNTAGYIADDLVTIDEFDSDWGDYWKANGYEIKEGQVISSGGRPTFEDLRKKIEADKHAKFKEGMNK